MGADVAGKTIGFQSLFVRVTNVDQGDVQTADLILMSNFGTESVLLQKQKLDEIFLSPIFKKKNNPKLEIYKYLNLKKMIKVKDIALGGINKQNIKRLKLVNSFGFAGIEYFEQKKRI